MRPASVVLKTPRSAFGAQRLPTAAMYATFQVGRIENHASMVVSWRPSKFHVRPASVGAFLRRRPDAALAVVVLAGSGE